MQRPRRNGKAPSSRSCSYISLRLSSTLLLFIVRTPQTAKGELEDVRAKESEAQATVARLRKQVGISVWKSGMLL